MDKSILELYDEYTHAPLPRRLFLERLARLTGSAAAAAAILPMLEVRSVSASVVAPDDPRLVSERVTYPGVTGDIKGYLVRPKPAAKKSPKLPAVIVIHENRGLTPHIEDVTRRVALEGFLALGVDMLSPVGGTPANEDAARELFTKLDPVQTVQNLAAAVTFLEKHPNGNKRVGAVGFCWGGGMVGDLAVNAPALDAGVVYYGRQPKGADVPKIVAPLMLHYASLDTRINEGIPAFETALKTAKKAYTLHMYEGVNHAFNNDSSAARYNMEAADLAWSRTIAFFKDKLKG
ncbi:MAG: dienelactone hydrolase family protein [Blastocatellia bacterium]|jgi:carboxymethylenebutenolidase|nr:dienelactone hydrolase family protein [Blastocatellia bacterium]MBK6427541.1 dienelactone hydrolase family protein [Blastocatellia bacterium]